jgi:hypothetical protein
LNTKFEHVKNNPSILKCLKGKMFKCNEWSIYKRGDPSWP